MCEDNEEEIIGESFVPYNEYEDEEEDHATQVDSGLRAAENKCDTSPRKKSKLLKYES